MTTITTDMFHHRTPFSPAFIAATRIGMVCAALVDRNSARRYSFQAKDQDQERGRREPGLGERQDDLEEVRKRDGAVELGALLQIDRDGREEVVHQPDHDRQIDHHVGDDQREMRVEQAAPLEHHVDRNHRDDRRQDALRDHPEQDVAIGKRPLKRRPSARVSSTKTPREPGRQVSASRRPSGRRRPSCRHYADGEERRWRRISVCIGCGLRA